MTESVRRVEVTRTGGADTGVTADVLAVEEPLEIRLQYDTGGDVVRRTAAITMRTPGSDIELAAGFLFTEGIIHDRRQITRIGCCGAAARPGNRIHVELAPNTHVNLETLERHSYTSSSCGVCGKTSPDALRARPSWSLPPDTPAIDPDVIRMLPASLRAAQPVFGATGGLHASALFDARGALQVLREDVGRHNALDKVIGAELLAGRLPVNERILIVSGRVSFELVQKALMAGVPVLAAIGAPSSLAVETARAAGMTLIGFVRDTGFNVYTGAHRLTTPPSPFTLDGRPSRSPAVVH